jgi:hypothetical protein
VDERWWISDENVGLWSRVSWSQSLEFRWHLPLGYSVSRLESVFDYFPKHLIPVLALRNITQGDTQAAWVLNSISPIRLSASSKRWRKEWMNTSHKGLTLAILSYFSLCDFYLFDCLQEQSKLWSDGTVELFQPTTTPPIDQISKPSMIVLFMHGEGDCTKCDRKRHFFESGFSSDRTWFDLTFPLGKSQSSESWSTSGRSWWIKGSMINILQVIIVSEYHTSPIHQTWTSVTLGPLAHWTEFPSMEGCWRSSDNCLISCGTGWDIAHASLRTINIVELTEEQIGWPRFSLLPAMSTKRVLLSGFIATDQDTSFVGQPFSLWEWLLEDRHERVLVTRQGLPDFVDWWELLTCSCPVCQINETCVNSLRSNKCLMTCWYEDRFYHGFSVFCPKLSFPLESWNDIDLANNLSHESIGNWESVWLRQYPQHPSNDGFLNKLDITCHMRQEAIHSCENQYRVISEGCSCECWKERFQPRVPKDLRWDRTHLILNSFLLRHPFYKPRCWTTLGVSRDTNYQRECAERHDPYWVEIVWLKCWTHWDSVWSATRWKAMRFTQSLSLDVQYWSDTQR